MLSRRAKKTGDDMALSTHPQTARLAIFFPKETRGGRR